MVPIELPGESVPPALIRVVGKVPVPPRSVPALTSRPLEAAIEPFTMSAPVFNVVAPV